MKKELLLALFGYCAIPGTLVAQKSEMAPFFSIELSKMQMLYVGVDNPIQLSCEGLSPADFRMKADRGSLDNKGNGRYIFKVKTPGDVTFSVYVGGQPKFKQNFRVKPIPDPVPALGAKIMPTDSITVGHLKACLGITLLLQNFDFDVKCDMIEYTVTLIGDYHDTGAIYKRSVINKGVRFSKEAKEILIEGETGDIYIFSDIKARCPGDLADRKLPPLVFFTADPNPD